MVHAILSKLRPRSANVKKSCPQKTILMQIKFVMLMPKAPGKCSDVLSKVWSVFRCRRPICCTFTQKTTRQSPHQTASMNQVTSDAHAGEEAAFIRRRVVWHRTDAGSPAGSVKALCAADPPTPEGRQSWTHNLAYMMLSSCSSWVLHCMS